MAPLDSQARMGIQEKEVWTEVFISIFHCIFDNLTKHLSASSSTVKISHDIISFHSCFPFVPSVLGRDPQIKNLNE